MKGNGKVLGKSVIKELGKGGGQIINQTRTPKGGVRLRDDKLEYSEGTHSTSIRKNWDCEEVSPRNLRVRPSSASPYRYSGVKTIETEDEIIYTERSNGFVENHNPIVHSARSQLNPSIGILSGGGQPLLGMNVSLGGDGNTLLPQPLFNFGASAHNGGNQEMWTPSLQQDAYGTQGW